MPETRQSATDPADCRVVLCTCPDSACAARLAGGLVEHGLAACVNVIDGIRSIYRWQGEVSDDSETLMIIKTTGSRYPELQRWLERHHPYDVPEVIALDVSEGAPSYLEWVASQTRPA